MKVKKVALKNHVKNHVRTTSKFDRNGTVDEEVENTKMMLVSRGFESNSFQL